VAEPACPICASRAFGAFNGRPRARCLGCGSLERGRQQWMILQRCAPIASGASIAHFAPERFYLDRLGARTDIGYRAFDKHPEHYLHDGVAVEALDLCADLGRLPERSFDLVIHNHVLEHLPCPPEPVLAALGRLLRPGGVMLFSVPIVGERSVEGLDPAATPHEQAMRDAQGDHLRIFGSRDFPEMLRRILGSDCMARQGDLFSPADLRAAAVPIAKSEPNGKSSFLYRVG